MYSVAALKRIPYRLNSNVFHFDTEIIIQLLNAGQRIVELPIPTYYGDEICRVNGMKYAEDVLLATLQNVAHRAGLLYQRRFDPLSEQGNAHYDLKLGYPSSHQFALDAVPPAPASSTSAPGPAGSPASSSRRAVGWRSSISSRPRTLSTSTSSCSHRIWTRSRPSMSAATSTCCSWT